MATVKDLMKKLENFRNEIEKVEKVSVTILPDCNGMIDRQCPSGNCKTQFKVNLEDWENTFRDEQVFCPGCGNHSEAKDYLPSSQRSEIIDGVRQSILDSWKTGRAVQENSRVLQSTNEFEEERRCNKCSVRFSVSREIARFCPNCGEGLDH